VLTRRFDLARTMCGGVPGLMSGGGVWKGCMPALRGETTGEGVGENTGIVDDNWMFDCVVGRM